ncbi:MAG: MFS transporter [Candidatus Lokiarchaeota archaeon]|nr:MFS transporter [Candidatus Lokiarchaeota archaeon]
MKKLNQEKSKIKRYPKRILASFQLGNLINLTMSQLFSLQLPYYYLDVIGLNATFYLIGSILFMIYNMINDPILGNLCDKSTRFTKKWGKRFPFIMMGAIPWVFMPIFIFLSPTPQLIGQIGVFLWFLIFQSIYDTAFSLYDINRVALFPDKFRSIEDRKIAGSITVILETIGVLIGLFIPVIIIGLFGNDIGYFLQAVIISLISFFIVLLMIPGVREDEEIRTRRFRLNIETDLEPFFKGIISTLKDRNFLGYMIFFSCYGATMGIVMGTIPNFVEDILLLPKLGEFIVGFYILSVIPSALLWYKFSSKLGIKKTAVFGSIIMFCVSIPLLFIPRGSAGLSFMIIILIIFGFADAAIISMTMPLYSSVIDNAAVKTGKRREGLYNGTWVFFSRIGIAIKALVFWIVRSFFKYQAGTSDPFKLLGIRLQMSIFPMITISIGIIFFWYLYKLSDKKIEKNTQKLIELNL